MTCLEMNCAASHQPLFLFSRRLFCRNLTQAWSPAELVCSVLGAVLPDTVVLTDTYNSGALATF